MKRGLLTMAWGVAPPQFDVAPVSGAVGAEVVSDGANLSSGSPAKWRNVVSSAVQRIADSAREGGPWPGIGRDAARHQAGTLNPHDRIEGRGGVPHYWRTPRQ
ncbi:MAG: hypothetical protein ACLPXB_19735 [Thiobacillaceae bacterium]